MAFNKAKYYYGIPAEELDGLRYRAAIAEATEIPYDLHEFVVVFGHNKTPKYLAQIVTVNQLYKSIQPSQRLPQYLYTVKTPSGGFVDLPATHFERLDGERMERLKSGNKRLKQIYALAKESIEAGRLIDLNGT